MKKNPLGLLSMPAMDLTMILSAFTFSSLEGRNLLVVTDLFVEKWDKFKCTYFLVWLYVLYWLGFLFYLYTQERRTRISGKLKKLQDLVPNMDKVNNMKLFYSGPATNVDSSIRILISYQLKLLG